MSSSPQPNTRLHLSTLPSSIIYQIFTYLPPIDLSPITSTSRAFRHLVAGYFLYQRQKSLAKIYSLQSKVTAANLPNELLVEVFSYLSPIDFYNTTKVCSTWRQAGSYRVLVRKNVYAAQPLNTQPPEGCLDEEFKTLAFYLQASGQLKSDPRGKCIKHNVSTLYLKQRVPEKGQQQSTGDYYPQIHLSEDGHHFLAAERAHPWRVHVYCTYRTVLSEDISSLWGSNPIGFHEWDITPTYLLTLPETGRVVSASFGPAMCGGVEYNKAKQSYSKGLDLLVLFKGAQAQLYKIRESNERARASKPRNVIRKSVAKRLVGWARTTKPPMEKSMSSSPKWKIWDSMGFSNVLFSQKGPATAKLGDKSERVIFATGSFFEVWDGVNKLKEGEVWDKDAAVKMSFSVPGMPGKVAQIFTGRIWHTGLGKDVEYTVCSNRMDAATVTPENPPRPQGNGVEGSTESRLESQTNKTDTEMACTVVMSPAGSFKFNYSNLVPCMGYNGAPLYLGLTPQHTLSQIQLTPTLNTSDKWCTDAFGNTSYKPYSFAKKSELALSSIPSSSNIAHVATICTPTRSIHPVIAIATDCGAIYIYVPQPCRASLGSCFKSTCSSSASFERLARIPPGTGGKITDLKISFRGPVWDYPRRDTLYSNDAKPGKDGLGALVVVVATDRGRVEVCYFDPQNRLMNGKRGLESLGAGNKWYLDGGMISRRIAA